MKVASVSYSKNHLSALLEKVKRGESVIITDRGHAVARLQPIGPDAPGQLTDLVRRGIVTPARRKLDLKAFLKMPRPSLKAGETRVRAVIEERAEGR